MWKPFRSYEEKARKIIADNNYMTLATCTQKGEPWAAVVFYVYDKDYNFYFLSAIDSRHAKNIEKNPKVSAVMFDSSAPIGTSDEVQIEGNAEEVDEDTKNIKEVVDIYCARLFPNSSVPAEERYHAEAYTKPSEFRFYKIRIKAAYTTGAEGKIRVDLSKK